MFELGIWSHLRAQRDSRDSVRSFPALIWIRLLRPRQWTKNLFVWAPIIFAREFFDAAKLLDTARAFAVFSLAASVVYILNDIIDAPSDRLHPVKRFRPIAAGLVTPLQGALIASVLLAVLVLLLIGMSPSFIAIVSLYVLLNCLYSVKLKEVVLLDVFIIAAGFMLRVLGGALAINVYISSWLVLCSLFISLFLGFGKRRGELALVEGGVQSGRRVLAKYRLEYLDQMLTISGAGALISYALYTVAPRTIAAFGTENLIYTTILVCFGIFRYLYLVRTTSATEDPTTAVLSDPPILIAGFCWIALCFALIYSGSP